MKTKTPAKKAPRKKPEMKLIEKRLESIDNRLLEIDFKTLPLVDCTTFHFPDQTGTLGTSDSFYHFKFSPVVNQEIVFDFEEKRNPIIRRMNETDIEFTERTNVFKEKFSGKAMLVQHNYYVLTYSNYNEAMLENHIFLTFSKSKSFNKRRNIVLKSKIQ